MTIVYIILQQGLCRFLWVVYAIHALKSQHKYSRKKNIEQNKKDRNKERKQKKEKYQLWRILISLIMTDDKETSYLTFLYNDILINQG